MTNRNFEGFRLSPQQKFLWLLQQNISQKLEQESLETPFCSQIALWMNGHLQEKRLQDSLKKIIQRHDILKTNYQPIQGIKLPAQVINVASGFNWEKENKITENIDNLDSTIETIFQKHRKKLLNLGQDTLFYASLLTLSETEHLLLLSLPALNGDAETLNNLTQEIYNIYHQKNLDEEPIQYLQFSEWQNELLEEEAATEGFNYWQQEKQQSKPSLTLPFEKPTSNLFTPKTYTLKIDQEITEKIKSLTTAYNITIDNFLLTCWQILLSKLTNETDIIVNTTYNGRTYEELQAILGLVSKSIPIYRKIDESIALKKLLIKTHETVDNHRPWQEYYLRDETKISPIAFEFQNHPKQYQGDEISISFYQQYTCSDRFKLKLFALLQENSLKTQFYYDANSLHLETIKQFADYFQTLLTNIITQPNVKIKDLEILNNQHLHQLLIELNQTQNNHPHFNSFSEKFEQQVKQTPDNIAVIYEDKKLTYTQLNDKANQLAHHLIKLGVKPDTPVPAYGDRSSEMLIAMLGIMKAGAAYLPIDLALPLAGLQQRLTEAKADILITKKSLINPQSLPNHQIIYLDEDWNNIAQNSSENPQLQVTLENLAYLIFTSGSTGHPKGVAIEHKQLLNYLHSILTKLDIPTNANFALVSTLAADLGHTCIFPALSTGGCLHIISQERATNAKSLGDYFQHHAIDCLKIVPSHLQALLVADPQGSFLPRQRLILGGEATPWQLIDQIQQKAPNCRIFNHYGPTETTIGVTTFAIESQTPTQGTVPIGRPIDNTQLYILNEQLKPVPLGVAGELYIGGAGVARGYLNRPELTAERFINHPFNPQEKLYKTGDRVRYLSDGNIEFLGRLDNQVKIRGFRIELGEIEAILRQHSEISQAVVIAKEDNSGERRLVAYLVPQNSTSDQTQWRTFLQQKLPDYMIPSRFVYLKALPLTKNGKIDRQKLPDPQIQNQVEFVPPRNETETLLCKIWAEVLGIEKIGIHDNFFTLGGHSLQAIQLVSKISMAMNRDISVKSLFVRPTIAQFSEILEEGRRKFLKNNNTLKTQQFSAISSFIQVEKRSLLSLLMTGKIPPVDSAALTYFATPDFNQLEALGWTPQTLIEEFSDNLPIISTILETPIGRIALICLPQFVYELYQDKNRTINHIIEALEMAKQIGVNTVSLTGLLPSATDYGKAVTKAMTSRQDLPSITTGHGTTSATVVLSIENILRTANRNISEEKIGFLGLGSVGISTLRLMLNCLPHPQKILLCDVYNKLDNLEAIKQEIIHDFNFQGDVHLILSQTEVPEEMYRASLIVGATNVADILNIKKIKPGTLIIDDSAPHCFKTKQAIKRLETHHDILFTEGGILRPSEAIKRLTYLPRNIEKLATQTQRNDYLKREPFNITGCVFSSLLSTRFDHLIPTIDLVSLETSLQHYQVLKDLNFRAADLSCEGYQLPAELIQKFQQL